MFRSETGNPQVKHETGDEVRIEATQTGSKKTGMFVVFVLLVDPVSGSAVEQGMGTIEDFFNRLDRFFYSCTHRNVCSTISNCKYQIYTWGFPSANSKEAFP